MLLNNAMSDQIVNEIESNVIEYVEKKSLTIFELLTTNTVR